MNNKRIIQDSAAAAKKFMELKKTLVKALSQIEEMEDYLTMMELKALREVFEDNK